MFFCFFHISVCYNAGMSTAQRTYLANELVSLTRDIAAIDKAIREIATAGYASASLSSGGGSKSYTRLDLAGLRALRAELATRRAAVASALSGRSATGIRHLVTVRS